MYHLKAQISEIVFSADVIYHGSVEFFRDYFTDEEASIHLRVLREELKKEYQAYKSTAPSGDIILSGPMLEVTALHRLLSEEMLKYGYLLFHGSAIAVDDKCYIFTAPSGTGKSTHVRLWRDYFGSRAVMVNDDKPYLFLRDNRIMACGSPWNGKHHLSNAIEKPVKAICILSQSETNKIKRISSAEAFTSLYSQCYHSENYKNEERVLDILEQICERVEFYHLYCNMDSEAAIISWQGMNYNDINGK